MNLNLPMKTILKLCESCNTMKNMEPSWSYCSACMCGALIHASQGITCANKKPCKTHPEKICDHAEHVRCNDESCDGIGFYHEYHCAKCGDGISWFDKSSKEGKAELASFDWKEREKELFLKNWNLDHYGESNYVTKKVADYWLSRIEILIQQELARVDNSGRKLYQAGERAERDRWLNQKANEHDEKIRHAERAKVIALAEGMKKDLSLADNFSGNPAVWESEIKKHNQALSDFITQAKSE